MIIDFSLYFAVVYAVIMITLAVAAPKLGKLSALLAIALYALVDLISGKLGLWTIYLALTGAFVSIVFSKREFSLAPTNIGKRSLFGIIVFDLVTGLLFGIQFGQTLEQTILGQIPFTLSHIGTVTIIVGIYAAAIALAKYVTKTQTPTSHHMQKAQQSE